MDEKQEPKNCQDIIEEYLVSNGYDGLHNPDAGDTGCSCTLDELCPCG